MNHLKTFKLYSINENADITVKVNKALEERPEVIFDQLGLDMPSEMDGEEFEQLFDEAREKAIEFYTKNPDRLKNID